MRAHRFGRKLKLPSTIAIKNQIRQLALADFAKEKAEQAVRSEGIRIINGSTKSGGVAS
jgi:hypothetical protein